MASKILTSILSGAALLFIAATAIACDCNGRPLDLVTMQLQTEAWAKTTTPNVSVNIDATLDKVNVSQIREEIMGKLAKIDKDDWQISSFNQTQNESGLEEIHAIAELRMNESTLANLQTLVKDITRPGLNFKVANIDFSPAVDDLEKARAQLREKIYAMVTAEIDKLEKAYAGQKYTIHIINFNPEVAPVAMAMADGNFMVRGAARSDKFAQKIPMLTVSTKVRMTAAVELTPVINAVKP
jgi:hypothetical protein